MLGGKGRVVTVLGNMAAIGCPYLSEWPQTHAHMGSIWSLGIINKKVEKGSWEGVGLEDFRRGWKEVMMEEYNQSV